MFSPPNWSSSDSFLYPKLGPWTVPLWLHRKPILDAVTEAAPILNGKLLDVGCGNKPYASVLRCGEHIGVDVETSSHSRMKIDKIYDGVVLPFGDAEFDSILCTEVLEHCRDPQRIVQEMWRVLKPGGYALITAPMVIHHHEEPWDFQRFTRYGMEHLARQPGLGLVWIKPRGGVFATSVALFYCALAQALSRRPFIDVILWMAFPFSLALLRFEKWRNRPVVISLGWQMLVRK